MDNLFGEINDLLANRQSWRKESLCAQDTELRPWFTADHVPVEQRRKIREMCEECPVSQECTESAMGPRRATAGFWSGRSFNVWGGTK